MTWVLMFAIMSGQGHTTNSQEFDTEKACQRAALSFKNNMTNSWSGKPYAICVPKGDE